MTDSKNTDKQKGLFHLILGAAGIYFSYVILAIYSEKLYSSTYQSSAQFDAQGQPLKHRFEFPHLLVWFSALCCAAFGYIRSFVTRERTNPISLKQSATLGTLFCVNMTSTNFALLYISYPTQVIARNSRYLFVVIIGTFFSRVPHKDDLKLPVHKIYVALLITFGVILFNVMKIWDKGESRGYPQEWKGYLLLLLSMVADALFCDSQAYCKVSFKPSANHLFTAANTFAFLISIGYAIVAGNFLPSLMFILQHPACLRQLIYVCVLQVSGQVSIYYIVANFKQHIFPLISATRKIITIVFSIFYFNHVLGLDQWVAVFIVFAGMIIQVYEEVNQKKKKSQIKQEKKLSLDIQSQKVPKNEKIKSN